MYELGMLIAVLMLILGLTMLIIRCLKDKDFSKKDAIVIACVLAVIAIGMSEIL